MLESDLLSHIYARSAHLAGAFPWLEVGPGDDCAVIRADGRLLLKVDQLVEHRHFTNATPLDLIARKAMARPISDIAAMAGRPLCALAGATLPGGYPQDRADALFDAMSKWAAHFNCPLVGGDIASHAAPDAPLTLSISIVGTPHPVRGPVLRSGAQPGDDVFVTGSLGGSFDAATGLGKHTTFTPRLAEASWLAATLNGHLHAMMDISDALGMDAGRLARASRVRVLIDQRLIPLSPGVSNPNRALRDGEDYELLFTAAAGALAPTGTTPSGCTWKRIGATEPGEGAWITTPAGLTEISALGWNHT